ncbi:MAG: TolC family protein [Proteobacteria bacterium]|nr:TolC family protein [Cystobacterineae bacterium]MCL2258427.1 TolC family protein [Cystobacterineae bacterium]MCL2315219.1 TolC family protein [Pseudomonadota bacterium]
MGVLSALLSVFAILLPQAEPGEPALPLSRERLIELAQSNDGRIHIIREQLSILEAKRLEARWAWFPKFETTFVVAGPVPEARNDGLGGPPATEASYAYDWDWGRLGVALRADMSAVLPLYTFGKLSALRELAAHAVGLGHTLEVKVQEEIRLQVLQAYWGFQLARQARASLGEGQERLGEVERLLLQMEKAASMQVSKADFFKLKYYRKLLDSRQGEIEAGERFALAALEAMVGRVVIPMEEDIPEPGWEIPSIEECMVLALGARVELRSIEEGVGLREAGLKFAQSQFWPDIGVVGFVRWAWASNTTRQYSVFASDPFHESSAGIGLMLRMTFDIPQKVARLKQAQGELRKTQREREAARVGLRVELTKFLGELRGIQERAWRLADAEKEARRWATAAVVAFELGTGEAREVFDAYLAWLSASSEKLKAHAEFQLGLAALERAVGTRWGGG